MDLSTSESTLKYLKEAIPGDKAYEFILYAIPLLHELFHRMEASEIESILDDDELNPLYGFVIDIMEEFHLQESEREMESYRATKKT